MNETKTTMLVRILTALLIFSMVVMLASCVDRRSTEATVAAQDGAQGQNGANGAPGTNGTNGLNGVDGTNGLNGVDGTNGSNGTSCAVSSSGLVSCGTTTFQLPNGLGISSYIRPCGSEFANDEIFLRMSDNNILALYDGGPHEDRLTLLAPGTYYTTDRNRNMTCTFTVTNDLQLINQVVRNANGNN